MTALVLALALAGCQVAPRMPTPEPPQPTPAPAPAAPRAAAPAAAVPPTPRADAAPAPEPTLDVYERLRARLTDQHCDDSEAQRRWLRLYAPRPDRFARQLEPMLPLLEYVLGEIEARDLPGEFALIPIIESHYRPLARSPQGPAGMWQFTRDTAGTFGLRVSSEVDERLSVVRATDAALTMLGGLQESHDDWALAAAGYNAGPYRLRKLLERQPEPPAGTLPTGLARITYEYVEKLRTWACLLSEPERHGIELPPADAFERLVRVPTPPRLKRLPLLAEVSGLPPAQLRHWNPLLRDLPRPRGDADLLLPEDAARDWLEFAARVRRGEIPIPEPRLHTVAQGDTLSAIAARYGVSIAELRQWNRLDARALLRIGQSIRLEP
ncbi:MAG: transglycosylase SLT domain-containing protein [Aquimonas sp.]|nr:transglycosylase SLT domain-containing protein [Aquimonas sp.]